MNFSVIGLLRFPSLRSDPIFTGGDPLDEARSIIDQKIARLEESVRESIRALKSRRNELSPISRLPTEILCNIFKFSLTDYPRPETWTNFNQVSQHWRSSALSAPELWTNIILSYPRWTQEMLKRSKKAKLTLRSGFSGRVLRDFCWDFQIMPLRDEPRRRNKFIN